ncbi:MAG: PDC sensor domain-containing protein, partial [Prochlorothrix sp.]
MPRRISLRLLLTVPFALQMALGMGLVIGLAYRQEQRNLANFLDLHFSQTQGLISQELDQYLQQAHTINQSNLAALRSGVISLDRLDQLHAYLIAQHQLLPDVTTILLGTETGDFRTIHWLQPPEQFQQTYVRPDEPQREAGRANPQDPSQLDLYALDGAGQFSRYLETLNNIDVRDRPWYRAAIASGEPGWSDLFAIGASNLLALNAYAPIYRRDLQVATADRASSRAAEEVLEEVAEETAEEIIGVFSVNIALETLDSFLQSLQVVQRYQGYVFLMEADGSLLANSWGIPSQNSDAKPITHPSRSKRSDQPGLLSF